MAKLCLKPRKYDQLGQYQKYLIVNVAASRHTNVQVLQHTGMPTIMRKDNYL
jgi:hypothetical protein